MQHAYGAGCCTGHKQDPLALLTGHPAARHTITITVADLAMVLELEVVGSRVAIHLVGHEKVGRLAVDLLAAVDIGGMDGALAPANTRPIEEDGLADELRRVLVAEGELLGGW